MEHNFDKYFSQVLELRKNKTSFNSIFNELGLNWPERTKRAFKSSFLDYLASSVLDLKNKGKSDLEIVNELNLRSSQLKIVFSKAGLRYQRQVRYKKKSVRKSQSSIPYDLDSINELREKIGLKPLTIKHKNCMTCGKSFKTVSSYRCVPCKIKEKQEPKGLLCGYEVVHE